LSLVLCLLSLAFIIYSLTAGSSRIKVGIEIKKLSLKPCYDIIKNT